MNHIAIPVEIINKVLTRGNTEDLRVFFFLKNETSGHFKLNKATLTVFCKKLGICSKTFFKYLKILLKNGWVTYNSKRKSYRIISTFQLARKFKIASKMIAIYQEPEFVKKKFDGFIAGTSITYHAERLKRKNQKEMKNFGINIGSSQFLNRYKLKWDGTSMSSKRRLYKIPYLILPNDYFAKTIKKDVSTASRYKKNASKYKFIKVKKVYDELPGLSVADAKIIKKRRDFKGKLLIRKSKVYTQKPDQIESNIWIARRKRLLK